MTTLISVRLDEELLRQMRTNADTLQLSQTDYIRRAIEMMNLETEKVARSKRLKSASLRVRGESLEVNKEFGEIEQDPTI